MPNGEVLHPFAPQNADWNNLWFDRDGGSPFHVEARRLISLEVGEADRGAVKEVCAFFGNMKKATRSFQCCVEWKHPSPRIRSVLDRIPRSTPRLPSKQQRRSSTGISRNLPDILPGLAVEWNVDLDSSHVWNDNQRGASIDDPGFLTTLLRKSLFLPDESDFLAEGKKVIPVEVLSAVYIKFLDGKTPPPVSVTSRGGRSKGKGKYRASTAAQKPKWPPSDMHVFDLLMLPHPEVVNREEETYVVQGPKNQQTRVTKENWDTLRFNTKTMGPEYFPSSYLSPVPTVLEGKDGSKATFPRSTITGTEDTFRTLLLVPLLSKKNKVPLDVYRALSLNIASEATSSTDKATAVKRISTFLRLCHLYIPCEREDYDESVHELEQEVSPDLRTAKRTLEVVQEQRLPAIVKAKNEAISVILQVLYFLQQGHVLFLAGDYRARVLEAHGHDAFTAKARATKLGKDGLPRAIHDTTTASSVELDKSMSQEIEGDTTDSEDEGSESYYHRDVEGEQANTHVPSISQQESPQPPQRGSRLPGNSVEAAGFGSDTSPRNETGDNEELSRAERK
jgi:hypothetical protein